MRFKQRLKVQLFFKLYKNFLITTAEQYLGIEHWDTSFEQKKFLKNILQRNSARCS